MAEQKLDSTGMKYIDVYAVHVSFNERGYWSKAYTYKSDRPFPIGAIVLVPTNNFYAVGKVLGSEKGYNFKENVNYKFVKQELNLD